MPSGSQGFPDRSQMFEQEGIDPLRENRLQSRWQHHDTRSVLRTAKRLHRQRELPPETGQLYAAYSGRKIYQL